MVIADLAGDGRHRRGGACARSIEPLAGAARRRQLRRDRRRCAGVIGFPLDRFRKVIEVNLISTFNVLAVAAAKMAEGEPDEEATRGVIVNTASNAAFDGQIGQAAYYGVEGRRGRDDAADRARPGLKGIRVVTIAPGPSDTPMLGAMRDDIREQPHLADPVPEAASAAPRTSRALVQHIVENEYLNGEVIRLDGALAHGPPLKRRQHG